MKITCSILCYNYGRYLERAIESCLSQEAGEYELEVLVIDDGSTDETPDVCQKYLDRIRVLRSPNEGFGASLSKAIREASGDYVCLLDADDYFNDKKILTILPYINLGYLYIANNNYFVNSDGNLVDSEIHGGGNTSTLCLNRTAALSLLPVQNEIFFDPLKLAGCGISLAEALTFYRIHTSSMIRSKPPHIWYTHLAEVTHSLANKLSDMSKSPPSWTNSNELVKMSKDYQSTAYYDEMESALQLSQKGRALMACIKIFLTAIRSKNGFTIWHFKVIARGLLGKPMIQHK